MQKIIKASAIYGMGDALNARSFLAEYCRQKDFPKEKVYIYTVKHWWMFEGMGFKRSINDKEFLGLTPFKNFGLYNILKLKENQKLDLCIAENAGIKYTFDTITPLPHYDKPKIKLPKRYITINTGFGEFSGKVGEDYICTKAYPLKHWNKLVEILDIPCVQIGAGASCEIIKGAINLVDKLTIKESAEVMRRALFHIDMEGGLSILNQHLGKKSVVLFGATAIENQGREFNLNLSSNVCPPCYEWKGATAKVLYAKKTDLKCGLKCMEELKPSYVLAEIKKTGWLKNGAQIESKYIKG